VLVSASSLVRGGVEECGGVPTMAAAAVSTFQPLRAQP